MNYDLLKKSLKKNKEVKVKLIGKSMVPILREFDFIILKKPEKLKIGDIVIIKGKKEILAHRIILRHKKTFLIKGDNRKNFDGFYFKNDIFAKVKSSSKHNFETFLWKLFSFFIAIISLFIGSTFFTLNFIRKKFN